jgi:hypothetical protein
MIFDAPNGLRYDSAIHDFIETDGSLATAERIAQAWGMSVEEVEQDRQALANLKAGKQEFERKCNNG